jgi:hypothetical protein
MEAAAVRIGAPPIFDFISQPRPEERACASRRTATGEVVPAAILRDGRASKSAVADFDTLTLPKSGKPDFGERGLLRMF